MYTRVGNTARLQLRWEQCPIPKLQTASVCGMKRSGPPPRHHRDEEAMVRINSMARSLPHVAASALASCMLYMGEHDVSEMSLVREAFKENAGHLAG